MRKPRHPLAECCVRIKTDSWKPPSSRLFVFLQNGKKAYANQAWRLGCTTLTMLSAGGVFWAAWRLCRCLLRECRSETKSIVAHSLSSLFTSRTASSNVKRINMSLPEAPKTSPKDARKALLNRYSQASVEIETFLPPHPFSARADKIYNYKLSELRLDGPVRSLVLCH